MTDPIIITFQMTLEQFVASQDAHRNAVFRKPFRLGATFLAVVFVLAAPLVFSKKGFDPLIAGMAALGVYWLALRPIERPWTLKRTYRRIFNRDRGICVTIRSDGIVYEIDGLASSVVSWAMFSRVVASNYGCLLYLRGETSFFWIPFATLKSEDEVQHVIKVLAERVTSQSPGPT